MDTEVYSCMDDGCIGWMRKDFASSDLKCPLCGNETSMEVRELPKINQQQGLTNGQALVQSIVIMSYCGSFEETIK